MQDSLYHIHFTQTEFELRPAIGKQQHHQTENQFWLRVCKKCSPGDSIRMLICLSYNDKMGTGTRRKRDFNPEDLDRLLMRFDPDPVHAWECYDKLRKRLVIFFEHNHCLEAEELAEEVLDRVAR